jgi:hypothetical protein
MNGEDMTKAGIGSLLTDLEVLEIQARVVDMLRARVEHLRDSTSRAGKANSARYNRLRDLCVEVYCDVCLSRITKRKLRSRLLASSATDLQKLFTDIRPPFKNFGPLFHDKSQSRKWLEHEQSWLKSPSAGIAADTTLHKWWKNLNKDLGVVLKKFPDY